MQDLTVTLVQTSLEWEDVDSNLQRLSNKIEGIKSPTDLIILPEMFTTGFTLNPEGLAESGRGKAFQWLSKMAEKSNATILGSIIASDKNQYFNRLLVCHPDGSSHKYDKKHLFAYAGEDNLFTPGSERLIFELKGWNICPMVCYDLRFPAWARNHYNSATQQADYDLLLYVANWPKPRIKAWDTLLSARAIENQSYTVGVNRVGEDANQNLYIGHSAVYDYLGDEIDGLKEKEGALSLKLPFQNQIDFRNKLPFLIDGDKFSFKS